MIKTQTFVVNLVKKENKYHDVKYGDITLGSTYM